MTATRSQASNEEMAKRSRSRSRSYRPQHGQTDTALLTRAVGWLGLGWQSTQIAQTPQVFAEDVTHTSGSGCRQQAAGGKQP
ncbi:hypothetical protein AWZ03_001078 [Drosophila navojoa]|uniref:Uncharacterized protein n=1 Tax=Drosophila navojoa TaxID=7232 RepID=A0A484BYA0_DRONA|nr:hypothetical protein AWZ03_001078 [Drosophila navojoa]